MSRRKHTPLEPYELDPQTAASVDRMTEESESDIAEMRVNIRWGKAQVDTLKRAAGLFGVPYQTYAKQAAMRQAIADLRAAFQAPAWLPLNEPNVPRAVLDALEGKPDFETVTVDSLTYMRVSGQVAVAVPESQTPVRSFGGPRKSSF